MLRALILIAICIVGCKTTYGPTKSNDFAKDFTKDSTAYGSSPYDISDISFQIQRRLEFDASQQLLNGISPKLTPAPLKTRVLKALPTQKKIVKKQNVQPVSKRSVRATSKKARKKKSDFANRFDRNYKYKSNDLKSYVVGSKKKQRRTQVFIPDSDNNRPVNEMYAGQATMHHIELFYQAHVARNRKASRDVLGLVKTVDSQLRDCYLEHIASSTEIFQGKVTYRFKIKKMSQGFNQMAQKPNKGLAEDLGQCIVLTLGRLRFTNSRSYKGNLQLSFKKVEGPKIGGKFY